jgi:hypothetical protein
MTHEELLAICDNYSFKDSAEPVKALRAVVELHKPIKRAGIDYLVCDGCYEEEGQNNDYPCPTIQDIEKELS